MKTIILILPIFISFAVKAQNGITQTIRGVITDKDSKQPLVGASILLTGSQPQVGCISSDDGTFRLTGVAVGRQSISVSYMGYKTVNINNIIVYSGKETVLPVEMEEELIQVGEVEISAPDRKDKPVNRMASVSARSFTIEETERYAGSRGDVARMAMNYAGVAGSNDQRNDIIIRGNSPSGLLWRLDDIEIPNPNHYANEGTTGGPVGILNNNVLQNSDFFTGAFPAEYGNALSGVFDLKMRNGNNEKHEFLFQSGFNGFELGAEGPFANNYKGSYLLNYRYSTLELMDGIIDFGTGGIPKYQDYSYKINLPTKKGGFTIEGLGGTSQIAMLDSKKDEKDLYSDEGMDLYNGSDMGAAGLSYTHRLSAKTQLKLIVNGLFQQGWTHIDTLDSAFRPSLYIKHYTNEFKISSGGYINTKFSSHYTQKIGITADRIGFDMRTSRYENDQKTLVTIMNEGRDLREGTFLIRSYYQSVYKISQTVNMHPGVHFNFFQLTGDQSLEPRMALSWQIRQGHKLSIGYGLHSKTQSASTYYFGTRMPDGTLAETNTHLDFSRSHQAVLGYDWNIAPSVRLKTETYYQYIFNVPVEIKPSSFSMLNIGAGWGVGAIDSLINKGTGKNYGIEFTLEKFFSNHYYFLNTLSLFESKYTGSNGKIYNTAFNGNYVLNTLAGREFPAGKHAAFSIDMKMT